MIQKDNENLDLTIILKGCPKGTEFYHVVYGKVTFLGMDDSEYPIDFKVFGNDYYCKSVTKDGKMWGDCYGECVLFPSKDQRDWSKFERFWDKPKVEKFDINTLQTFDKVLVRCAKGRIWFPDLFGYKDNIGVICVSNGCTKRECIPYNDETKHLIGTTDDCPEYYKWWKEL